MSTIEHQQPEMFGDHPVLSIEQLLRERSTDQLTGLPNRRALEEGLPRILEESPGETAVLLVDLDGFKQINDTLGHAAGDEHLVQSATNLRQTTDERPGDEVFRLGGDEFAILLRGIHSQEDLDTVSHRIQEGIDKVGRGGSVGGSRHMPGQAAQDLLGNADTAMYEVKKGRKQAAFEALPRRKRVAARVGHYLTRYAGVNVPRQ